jgi:hypothetical protein
MKTPSIAAMPAGIGAPAGGKAVMPSDRDGDEKAPAGPDAYQTKADMMTLMEAHKIKADKPRHAAAKALAKTQMAHMAKISKGE